MRAHLLAAGLGALCASSGLLVETANATPAAAPPETVSSAPPRTPAEEQKAFRLPEGFVAELVASEPEIHKPLNIAFDAQGRLWVTETIEYPFPAPEGRTPRDSVKILSDFGPDGRARRVTTFADGLNIPIGLLPFPSGNEALVHSIPDVYKFSDTDGDGVADRREPFYRSIGFKDTHGMTNAFTWGFDGWIYACHGFSNESHVQGSDRQPIVMQSGNTYRMRADGSHAEVFTRGQVNPFGLAFDPLGNLYSSDCHSRPIYQLLRGACYPSFGKPDDGLGFGPDMIKHDHGSTGIAGVVYYAADHFPAGYRDTVFIGNVVTSRINHDSIAWKGSTPSAVEKPDFMTSDDPWFRPVDLKLGPDGALYVADFYNRIIGHYEVPLTHPGRDRERGRIWRIVYRGNDPKAAPRPTAPRVDWTTARSEALVKDLGHPNLTVRLTAANQLADRPGDRPVADLHAAVQLDGNPDRRVHALWVLQRWGVLSDASVWVALDDDDRSVRGHALRVLGERPTLDETAANGVRDALADSDPFVRRAAADTLGRHPEFANVKPLLAARRVAAADDTHLVHTLRMALRDQLRGDAEWVKLKSSGLDDRERADVADVALGVPSAASADYLLDHVREAAVPQGVLTRDLHHVARYIDPARRSDVVAVLMSRPGRKPGDAVALLKAVAQGVQERGAVLDSSTLTYAMGVARPLLESSDGAELAAGIDLAGSLRLRDSRGRLGDLARDESVSPARRSEVLTAFAAIDPAAAPGLLGGVLADSTAPAGVREKAAALLAQSGSPEAKASLTTVLPTAPERLQSAIAAGLAARREGAEALLTAVSTGKASARLLQNPRVAGPLAASGVPDLAKRLPELLKGLPPADKRLEDLIKARRAGFSARGESTDLAAGAKVFETQCASCHQIGGKGSRIGPQLDGIGGRGAERLIEDILDPNRNVDQTFRATTLALKDGRVLSGLLLREEGAVLVLADAQGKEVRVPSDSVEERKTLPLSPMPASFGEQVTEADFYQLLGFLISRGPAATAVGVATP